MRALFAALFVILAGISGFTNESPPEEELILSTPEEIGSHNMGSLIRGLVSPLSGNPSLRETDLLIRGAQEIQLQRIYTSPHILRSFHDKQADTEAWDKRFLFEYLSKNYKGWQIFPHRKLEVYPKDQIIRVCNRSGITVDFQVCQTEIKLFSSAFGISNAAGDIPEGKNDLRNTSVSIEDNGLQITVKLPDGGKAIYRLKGKEFSQTLCIYYLEKEILPNGKILKYHFQNSRLIYVESLSPDESIVYASIRLDETLNESKYTSSSHDVVIYNYEQRATNIKTKKWGIYAPFPPILTQVSSPFYRNETLKYSNKFHLDHYDGKNEIFQCRYGVFGRNDSKHYKLAKLMLPVGLENSFQEVCSIHYNPPTAGEQEGATAVQNADGTKTVYRFTKNFLHKAIETFDEHGILRLQKRYAWMDNGWLKSVEILDGEGNLFSQKSYKYDSYGNSTSETIIGDLSGSGNSESYTIKRKYSQDGRNLLLKEENEEGKITIFEYLPNTNLITIKFIQDKDQIFIREFYVYDEWNNLIQKIVDDGKSKDIHDLYGVTKRTWIQITLRQEAPFIHMPEWIEKKYLEDGEEKLAKRTHLSYDRWGKISQEDIYDSEGEFAYTTYKTYNERGDLLTETNALGQERTFSYDDKGRLIHSVNYSGRLHKDKTYDLKGRLIHEKQLGVEGGKKAFTYVYDSNDDLIEKIDEYENPTHYRYDLITHKPISCAFPSIESAEGKPLPVTSRFAYDPLGREIAKTDANGNTTRYKYNARGDKIEVLYPNDSKEVFRYYKNGKLKKYTDQEGLTILYEYDLLGRPLAKKYFSDKQIAEETFSYNAFYLLSKRDKEGNSISYSYDGLGRKIEENKSGRTIEYQFDSLGRLQATIYHNGNNTLIKHFERDLLDRILSEKKTDTSGNLLYKITYTYDEDGNKKEITRYIHNGPNTEAFAYDAFGRVREHKDALGYITRTTYNDEHLNSIGQKVLQKTVTDPKGIRIVKTYDALGRAIKREVWNPRGDTLASKEFIFDPCGNLLFEKDHIYKNTEYQKTQIISYCYNSSNLLQSFTRGFGTRNERTTFYTYIPSGKITSKIMPSGVSLCYGYNPLGYGTALASSDGSINYKFERDLLGNLLLASDEVNHVQIERKVDPFGNVVSEEFSMGLLIEKNYDALDRPLSIKIADHGQIHYTYDSLYLRSVSRISSSGTKKYSHKYKEYDLNGSLRVEDAIEECGLISHQVDQKGRKTALISPYLKQIITYDECDNLIFIEEDNRLICFAYDGLHQLIEENSPENTFSYAYDSNYNRVQKNQENAQLNELDELQSLGPITCEYDLNGNLITKKTHDGTMHFSYDALNQLVEARDKNRLIKFSYDPLGRRISKTVQESKNYETREASKEFYLWDGEEEIGAFDESGHCKNLKVLGATDPIAIELAGKSFAAVMDIQGNIRRLVNSVDHSKEISYNFTAFGERNSIESSLLNPWSYVGKRWDSELNLSYFGKRYYDLGLGRWLTSDPAGFVDGTNLYQFLFNNPFGYVDYDGQFAFAIPLIVWGAGAAAPTLAAIGAYIAAGVATGAIGYGGYKLYESSQLEHSSDTASTNKNTDIYVPDRPLPRDDRTNEPVSDTDASHTQLGTRGNKYPQAREFDKDGKPIKDIDFTDHGRPKIHLNPHEHQYEENSTGGTPRRGDPKPLEGWRY